MSPKVIDGDGFAVASPSGCRHKTLFFGAQGMHIICAECSAKWTLDNDRLEFNFQPKLETEEEKLQRWLAEILLKE